MILQNLKDDVQWVIWMDDDASTINMQFDIKEYLKNEQKKIIISRDYNNFNCGVFAVPNTDRAKQWLKYIYQQRKQQKYKNAIWHQQSAIIDSLDGIYSDFYKIPSEQIGFNNYSWRQKAGNTFVQGQSWCLHLPAKSLEYKQKTFSYYYDKLVKGDGVDKLNINPKILYAITTYDGYAYVQLSLASHKRFGNDVIVIDDGSLSHNLNQICLKYDVPLFNIAINSSENFANGDVISTTQAIQYAYFHGYDYVVKQSRRFVFKQNPTPSLIQLIRYSDANTFSTQWGGWGFVTCITVYKTSIWINAIKEIFNQKQNSSNHGLTEHYIHKLAQKYSADSQIYKNYLSRHLQKEDSLGYVQWQFINFEKRPKNLIWHYVNKPQDYFEYSKSLGLNYKLEDYQIIDSHQQTNHKKRPYL